MFRANLSKKIEKSGKSLGQIAIEANVSKNSLNNWRLGKNYPGSVELYKLAKYFGCTMEDLFDGEEI